MTSTPARSDQRVVAGWLAILLLSLTGAIVLTIAIMSKVPIPFDKSWLALATSWSAWNNVWDLLSTIGNYPMIPLGLGLVAWLWWTKRRREAVLVLIILAAATITSEALKAITARPRPSGPVPGIPGVVFSYPSGHALEDVMILGMYSVRLWRNSEKQWLRVGFAVLSAFLCVLIGIARVALNVHYPSDILAGFLLGLVFLAWYAIGTREGSWASHPGTSLAGFHLAPQT
jgi:membrane-associated phospholipid phosphatase